MGVFLILLLNSIDALATYFFVGIGAGKELNPIMDSIINYSPGLFLAVKLGPTNMLIATLYAFKNIRPKQIAVVGLLALYSVTLFEHCRILYFYLNA